MILRANSSHPQPLKRSIPVSQYICLKQISTTDEDFRSQARGLQSRFLERGYFRSLLKKAFNSTSAKNREQLLYQNKEKVSRDIVRCILTFNKAHHNIRLIFDKYWFLLSEDPILTKYLPIRPSITYRKSKAIGNRLVSSHFLEENSNDPCRKIGTSPYGSGDCFASLDCRTTATLPGGIT